MEIDSYTIEAISPTKRPAIWAVSGNGVYPLCYLQKPAWMSDEQFEKVVSAIRLDATKDFLDD